MTGRTFTPLSLHEECDLLCTKQGIIARLPGLQSSPVPESRRLSECSRRFHNHGEGPG